MRPIRVSAAAAAILGLVLAAVPAGQQAPVVAFENVSVIPMDRERVVSDQTILTRDGRIAELGVSGTVTGTLEPAKRADLVLLEANPLENIEHTSHIAGVMQGGRWLPRGELDRRLTASRRN